MNNEVFVYILIGVIFSAIYDIILGIANFLREEAWRVIDYEKIIYCLYTGQKFLFDREDLKNIAFAISRYDKQKKKDEKINQRIEKVKSFFKKRGE